jgi:hypothetical protein
MKIVLENTSAARAIELSQELKRTLRIHADFDYRFIPGVFNQDTYEYQASKVEFTFYNPADATMFRLKYL